MSMCLLLFRDRACMGEFMKYAGIHSVPMLTATNAGSRDAVSVTDAFCFGGERRLM